MTTSIPANESVFGNIRTSKDNHFIITYDVTSSKYVLYIVTYKQYHKLGVSNQTHKLMKKIQTYEARNDMNDNRTTKGSQKEISSKDQKAIY